MWGKRELELKLELTSEQLQLIAADPVLRRLRVGEPETRALRSIYFDSPDQRPREAGVSLRVRSDGEHWVQTIKRGTGVTSGVSSPTEVETVVGGPEPDLSSIEPRKVRRKIAKLLNGAPPQPVFETVVNRSVHRVQNGAAQMDLALDDGVVRSGTAEEPVCELELELKSGSAADLLKTAVELFGAVPARLAESNKAARGYGLVNGGTRPRLKPERAQDVQLAVDASCAEALGQFVESASGQIIANRAVVLETDDPEGPHQLRIGLRRLRSAIRLMRSVFDTKATREVDKYARRLARSVGELRDADVLIDDICAQVDAIEDERGLRHVRKALDAHRARTRKAARAALESTDWYALQVYLALLPRAVEESEDLQGPIADFAQHALDRIWKKVTKRAKRLAKLDPGQRHKLRKALKQLRYGSEFLGSLYKKRDVQPFLGHLKKLQDVIGYWNDVEMARQLVTIVEERCATKPACQRVAGYILGWHRAQAQQCYASADKGFGDLEQTAPFWR